MFVFVAGRRQGKSDSLIKWWLENPEYRGIIVGSEKMKQHLLRAIDDRTLDRWRDHLQRIGRINIMPVGQIFGTGGLRGSGVAEWAVDDAEYVLSVVLGIPNRIDYMTVNGTLVPATRYQDPNYSEAPNLFVDGDVVNDNENAIEARRALPRGSSGAGMEAGSSSLQVGTASYPRSGSRRNNGMDV